MRLLLDTHVLLWWLSDDRRLGADGRRAIGRASQVLVSAVTVWEIEIKRALGRLEAPDDLLDVLAGSGLDVLAFTGEHAVAAGRLPRQHDDPFDRALVAAASTEGLRLVTADPAVLSYDVVVLDVR